MKLFVALFPSKEVLSHLRDVRRKYAKHKRHLHYVPIDQLHVTLKYLGNKVSESSYQQIVDILKENEGNYDPIELSVTGVQFGFSKQSDPKVLMANVKATDQLVNLAEVVHSLVRDLKRRDVINFKKRYGKNFHITLGRSNDRTSRNIIKTLISESQQFKKLELGTFVAEEMCIVESEFSFNKGVTYKVLDRIKL